MLITHAVFERVRIILSASTFIPPAVGVIITRGGLSLRQMLKRRSKKTVVITLRNFLTCNCGYFLTRLNFKFALRIFNQTIV